MAIFEYIHVASTKDIRLIILAPGDIARPIRCKLINTNLESAPPYKAISYEWRTINEGELPIILNGSQFYVRQAQEVIVWLGPGNSDGDLAMSYIKQIGRHHPSPQLLLYPYPYIVDEIDGFEESAGEVSAFADWCQRSYWQRIWIVQEIQFARKLIIHCGWQSIPWEVFSCALQYLRRDSRLSVDKRRIVSSLPAFLDDFRESRRRARLLKDWLNIFNRSSCTDPRDKIYALISLASDCRDILIADYSKSLAEVYKDVLNLYRNNVGLFSFSCFLQNNLWKKAEAIKLTAQDTDAVWICGMFYGSVLLIDDKREFSNNELAPKNVIAGFTTSQDLERCENDAVSMNNYGSFQFMSRDLSMHHIEIGSSFWNEQQPLNFDNLVNTSGTDLRENIVSYWFKTGDNLYGFAPTQARDGDLVLRFPYSKVALIFRENIGNWSLSMWKGNPRDPPSVFLGSDKAIFLRLSYKNLQILTAI
ncbi:hypothetical protein B7463_g8359, partial [Scytalidium lignicola]